MRGQGYMRKIQNGDKKPLKKGTNRHVDLHYQLEKNSSRNIELQEDSPPWGEPENGTRSDGAIVQTADT